VDRYTYNSKQDALEDDLPAIAEFLELVALEPSGFDSKLTEALEKSNTQSSEDDEDHEKDQACKKDVGDFNLCSKAYPFNPPNDDGFCGRG